jgi:hypothetical protein
VSDTTNQNIISYDLSVTYDPAVVTPASPPYDIAGTLSSSMSITPNAANPGHLIISAFQSAPLTGAGTLIFLKFNVVGMTGQLTTLTFMDYTDPGGTFHPGFSFNEGDPMAITQPGSICVSASRSISGRVLTAGGRGVANAQITLTGNSLSEMLATSTTSFGNYRFDNLTPGETYVVTVNSARYTFSVPSRVISLADNASVDFIADPQQ